MENNLENKKIDITQLFKKITEYLKEGQFVSANELCNKIIEADSKNGEAYLYKMMAEIGCKKREDLRNMDEPFNKSPSYQKIFTYGNEDLRNEVMTSLQMIIKRNFLTEKEREKATKEKSVSIEKNTFSNEPIAEPVEETYIEEPTGEAEETIDEVQQFEYIEESEESLEAEDFEDAEHLGEAGNLEKAENLEEAEEVNNENQVTLEAEYNQDDAEASLNDEDLEDGQEEEVFNEEEYEQEYEYVNESTRKYTKIGAICAAVALGLVAVIAVSLTVIAPKVNYNKGLKLISSKSYGEAVAVFSNLEGYKDSRERLTDASYKYAKALEKKNDYITSALYYGKCGDYKNARDKSLSLWEKAFTKTVLAAGFSHTVALKNDGRAIAVGDDYNNQCSVKGWKKLVAVAAGDDHTVGLRNNGLVMAVGINYNNQCRVEDWKNIVSIAAGHSHTVGLRCDGTVIATGDNSSGQCNVSKWEDIIAISAGDNHTVGLKIDGTVVAAGDNTNSQCQVDEWANIIAIAAGDRHTVGLKKDGSVVATGDNKGKQCNVKNWKDIVFIAAGSNNTLGIKKDGTVVAIGDNSENQCDVEKWKNIVAVTSGEGHTVGLNKNGTLIATGKNNEGQCSVGEISELKLPPENPFLKSTKKK